MTDKNADVEFVRRLALKPPYCEVLLAHIDQLERDIEDFKKDALRRALCNEPDRRPTIHEIAAQIYAPMMRGMEFAPWAVRFAEFAYVAAEALVAEGRTRDGNE